MLLSVGNETMTWDRIPYELLNLIIDSLVDQSQHGGQRVLKNIADLGLVCRRFLQITKSNRRLRKFLLTTRINLLLLRWCSGVHSENFIFNGIPVDQRIPELCRERIFALDYMRPKWHGGFYDPLQVYLPNVEHRDYKVCLFVVSRMGQCLESVPRIHLTPEMCLSAVQNESTAFYSVPRELLSLELCCAVVRRGRVLPRDIPEEYQCEELNLHYVESRQHGLMNLPEEYRTHKVCMVAVRAHGVGALQHVPREHMTYAVCMAAFPGVPNSPPPPPYHEDWITIVPLEYQTSEMYLAVIRMYGHLVRYIPKCHHSSEFWKSALRECPYLYYLCPDQFRTEEELNVIAARGCFMLHKIPEEYRSLKVCMEGVRRDGPISALQWVPQKHRTEELYQVVATLADGLSAIPVEQRSLKVCQIALETRGGSALKFIPEKYHTDGLYSQAIQSYGGALEVIPEHKRTLELCQVAVQQCITAFRYVPKDFIDDNFVELTFQSALDRGCQSATIHSHMKDYLNYEMWLKLIQKDGGYLRDVPSKFCTQEMYHVAVEKTGKALAYIPPQQRTNDLCLEAVKQDPSAFWWVPDEHRTWELCCAINKVPDRTHLKD